MKFLFSFVIIFFSDASGIVHADQSQEAKIPVTHVITELPNTSYRFLKNSFSKSSLEGWGYVLGSTAILYHYDSDLYEGIQNTGDRWHIGHEEKTKSIGEVAGISLMRLPTDTGSTLYFLGDGWIEVGLLSGMFVDGLITGAPRPYNTALQMGQGLLMTMVIDQALKHCFGRESPNARTEPRGRWRPFAPLNEYSKDTSAYDAMPSGHMMTVALGFTVLRANYPEYDWFMLPLEITWMGALGFAMVNNGVHWASDYPLAIATGYAIGKAAVQMGGSQLAEPKQGAWTFFPTLATSSTPIMSALRTF